MKFIKKLFLFFGYSYFLIILMYYYLLIILSLATDVKS